MDYDAQSNIGDLVLKAPKTLRVFESFGIDYCCGGQRSLAEACAHAQKDLAEVMAALEAVPDFGLPEAPDPKLWQDAPLADLMAYIEARHHAFTRSELQRLAPLVAKVLQVHGGHHPELARVAQAFEAMQGDLILHLGKEEQVLFPRIRDLGLEGASVGSGSGDIQNPILVMEGEHEALGEILRELRAATQGYALPEDACGSYRSLYLGLQGLEEDLHLHIYLENHILFPRAIALAGANSRS